MHRRDFLNRLACTAAVSAAIAPLGAAKAASSGVRRQVEADGTLRWNGRREFILGLYQLPKREGALRDAAQAGFNLVSLPAERKAYDEAHALGVRGWSSVGSIPESGDRRAAEDRIRRVVESLRDHPGLWFWETEDEPTFVWKEPSKVRVSAAQILGTAAYIRRLDPAHPLYLNHSPTHLVSTLQHYNEGADIVATDIYPVIPPGIRESYALWPDGRQGDLADNTIGQAGRYAAKMRQVAGAHRSVFMVLQGFAWEELREKDRDPAMVLYPTLSQTRFMAWHSVVHGANGILWWGLAYASPRAEIWGDIQTVAREMARVRDALASAAWHPRLRLTYRETGHSLDRGIEWTARRDAAGWLLILVNADPNPVDVDIEGLNFRADCAAVVGPAPQRREGGGVRERFEPHGVRVWRFSKRP